VICANPAAQVSCTPTIRTVRLCPKIADELIEPAQCPPEAAIRKCPLCAACGAKRFGRRIAPIISAGFDPDSDIRGALLQRPARACYT